MSWASRGLARLWRLPPARTRRVAVERDLPVPAHDGSILLADRYYPADDPRAPLVLVRTPYGRRGVNGLSARLLAERGYQVLVQSCRGTFGSGGRFDPFVNEAADGLATLEWLRRQRWFGGLLATHGGSYVGFAHWALAAQGVPELRAMAVQLSGSDLRGLMRPGGSVALETALTWTYTIQHMELPPPRMVLALLRFGRVLRRAASRLPLLETDTVVAGHEVEFFRRWLEREPDDEGWSAIDVSSGLDRVTVPVQLLGGWYDIFLPALLADYTRLRRAGQTVRLVIGPWAHASGATFRVGLREALDWFDRHLHGAPAPPQAPVRIFVMGGGGWLDLPDWPPPHMRPRAHYLHPGGRLAAQPPPPSLPDHYRYDPARPTPAVGGVTLSAGAGPKDNRRLEARDDVLTYTGETLQRDLVVMGPVSAELFVRSSLEHTDFFVRLCDVDAHGRSFNLCDGLTRLEPGRPPADADGVRRVRIDLWPTAHRFRQGHRIRVQVSSGAHPRFARNLGLGEPVARGTAFRAADQEVLHDPEHPSVILLPL
jgi:putative CocE/NonD family hydrolase